MTFPEQMLDMWQNIFAGDRRFMFYIGFCIVTFGVPFLSIWISGVLMNFYFYVVLRKKYPEIYSNIKTAHKEHSSEFYYKQWLKGEIDINDPFCRISHKHDIFGKICIGIWVVLILSVGISALIKNFIQ